MAKFKFRLATLLRLREFARDERRTQLARAYQADEIVAQQERRLTQDLGELETRSREAARPGPLDVDQLLETRRYELILTAQKQHVRQQRRALAAEIEKRRRALVEADREVRVLEELREKQLLRHRGNENRLEIKQLDEVAQQRFRQEDDE
jgi:flagellar FliJ protein